MKTLSQELASLRRIASYDNNEPVVGYNQGLWFSWGGRPPDMGRHCRFTDNPKIAAILHSKPNQCLVVPNSESFDLIEISPREIPRTIQRLILQYGGRVGRLSPRDDRALVGQAIPVTTMYVNEDEE